MHHGFLRTDAGRGGGRPARRGGGGGGDEACARMGVPRIGGTDQAGEGSLLYFALRSILKGCSLGNETGEIPSHYCTFLTKQPA